MRKICVNTLEKSKLVFVSLFVGLASYSALSLKLSDIELISKETLFYPCHNFLSCSLPSAGFFMCSKCLFQNRPVKLLLL